MSAFPVGSLTNVFRYRPRYGQALEVFRPPQAASQTILKYDLLQQNNDGTVQRAIAPAGTDATFTASGNETVAGSTAPIFMAIQAQTTGASVTVADTIDCYRLSDLLLLMRLYHATAASSTQDTAGTSLWGGPGTGDEFEWGIYEIGTGSDNYFPCIDVANKDTSNGSFGIFEYSTDSSPSDQYGLVWAVVTGN